jgi:hypothetical protein
VAAGFRVPLRTTKLREGTGQRQQGAHRRAYRRTTVIFLLQGKGKYPRDSLPSICRGFWSSSTCTGSHASARVNIRFRYLLWSDTRTIQSQISQFRAGLKAILIRTRHDLHFRETDEDILWLCHGHMVRPRMVKIAAFRGPERYHIHKHTTPVVAHTLFCRDKRFLSVRSGIYVCMEFSVWSTRNFQFCGHCWAYGEFSVLNTRLGACVQAACMRKTLVLSS